MYGEFLWLVSESLSPFFFVSFSHFFSFSSFCLLTVWWIDLQHFILFPPLIQTCCTLIDMNCLDVLSQNNVLWSLQIDRIANRSTKAEQEISWWVPYIFVFPLDRITKAKTWRCQEICTCCGGKVSKCLLANWVTQICKWKYELAKRWIPNLLISFK